MTYYEIEELLEQSRSALLSAQYHEAETAARRVADADLSFLVPAQRVLVLPRAYRLLAKTLLKTGIFNHSLVYAQKALEISMEISSKKDEAYSLHLIGEVYWWGFTDFRAIAYTQSALAIYEELDEKEGIAIATGNLGSMYTGNDEYTRGIEYYRKAITLSEEFGLDRFAVICTGNLGNAYLKLADYPRAIKYHTAAAKMHEMLGNRSAAANVMMNIGSVYRGTADYVNSLMYYYKALSLFEELNMKADVAVCLDNIGITYREIADYPQSVTYLSRSIALHDELATGEESAVFIGNLGITYMRMKDYRNAATFLTKAVELCQQKGSAFDEAIFRINLSTVYFEIREFDRALDGLENALLTLESVGKKEEAVGAKVVLGRIFANPFYSGFDEKKAEHYLKEAIADYKDLASKRYIHLCCLYLADLYKHEKRWEEYAVHIEKHHELYIEVQNEEVKKQANRYGWERKIAEMEKEREIEKIRTEAEKQRMELEIEHQTREVENMVHELVRKNALLQQIQSDIKRITPHTHHEGTPHIEHLLERVGRNITPLESITGLEQQLTEVHGKFMNELQRNFPDLTAMELKIAALLNMKLTSSNIGSALFLSKRTVEFHRLNLRKKMGLPLKADIYAALAAYA